MFTVEDRETLRRKIIERARTDPQVTACALIGSAAHGDEDAWSDIDVALRLAEDADMERVASAWTAWMSDVAQVADHLDVHGSGALYRVFLLASSLQVDLSFWPASRFRSTGEPLRLVFGEAGTADGPSVHDHLRGVRMGWLYALHARSAIARGRSLQADMMLTSLRDEVIGLASIRAGLNPAHGRDAHRLSPNLSAELVASRASTLTPSELTRSLRETLVLYRTEVARYEPELATSLDTALDALLLD